MQPPKLRVIISGGGTGGHIFPAIAIANALKSMNPDNEILFVGANGRMEMEKVPAAGYRIVGLNISGIQRKLSLKNFLLPLKLIQSILKARRIVREFSPDAAVGVGGYASGPLLYAATSMGVPALIQEQNSYAGVTNKLLGRRVKKVCVAYEGMERFFPAEKIIMTGNPVREQMTQIANKRAEALKFFGLNESDKTVVVLGGSLGARTINEAIGAGLKAFRERNVSVIWQTGKNFLPRAREIAESAGGKGIAVFDFIQRMDYAYAAADLVISRAGASSVSELAIVGVPAILVPSPNVAEDHQTKNALALTAKNAAILVNDNDAPSELVREALAILDNHQQMELLKTNIRKLAVTGADATIAKEVYKLTGKVSA